MLSGVIYYGPKSEIGTVTENTDYGIFGTVSQTFLKEHRTASMEAARRQEVKTGTCPGAYQHLRAGERLFC